MAVTKSPYVSEVIERAVTDELRASSGPKSIFWRVSKIDSMKNKAMSHRRLWFSVCNGTVYEVSRKKSGTVRIMITQGKTVICPNNFSRSFIFYSDLLNDTWKPM